MGSALIRIFERPFYRKLHQPGEIGTTSAYAENTRGENSSPAQAWNYLRARGEYLNELGLLWHDSQKWAKIRSGI